MKAVTETSMPLNQEVIETKGKVEKKSGKRIGYNYIIIKSLKESQKNDVVKCLYIKSLTNFGFCVIKEGSYGETKDKEGRDIRDRLIWQQQLHLGLQDTLRLPRLLGSFEEKGNFYLVIQYIKGTSLYSELKEHREDLRISIQNGEKRGLKVIDYLLQISRLLEDLHKKNYVHRDVTPSNFMLTPGGKVYVIDMELAYSLEHPLSSPFQWGTPGYMSPEQKATQTPTIKDDVFSLGAILLQVLTGIHPLKLAYVDAEVLPDKIHFLIPDQKLANLVIQCLQMEATKRPDTQMIQRVLVDYKSDMKSRRMRPVSAPPPLFSKEAIMATVQQAISTLATPLLADEERGWFAEDPLADIENYKVKIKKTWYASFNLGVSGVMYLLSKAHRLGLNTEPANPFFNKGLQLIKERYVDRIDAASPSLHFGSAGIAISLSTAIDQGFIAADPIYIDWINILLGKKNTDINLATGIAGQGISCFSCLHFMDPAAVQQRIKQYVNTLIYSQQLDGSWIRETANKKNKKTRGLASGVAGIVLFLLECGIRYDDQHAVESAERGLQWLIKKAIKSNGFIHWTSTSSNKLGYGLLDGNSGIALVFLKAYKLLGASIYEDYAKATLRSTSPKLIDDNLGQGNGLSGLGEVYLEAFSILHEEEWLERTEWIVQLIMQLKKDHPRHGTYWLVENEKQPIPSFMTGNSGLLHFLLRYCHVESINFPILS